MNMKHNKVKRSSAGYKAICKVLNISEFCSIHYPTIESIQFYKPNITIAKRPMATLKKQQRSTDQEGESVDTALLVMLSPDLAFMDEWKKDIAQESLQQIM